MRKFLRTAKKWKIIKKMISLNIENDVMYPMMHWIYQISQLFCLLDWSKKNTCNIHAT